MAYGTNFSLDTIAAQDDTVAEIGEERVWEVLDGYFQAHNIARQSVTSIVSERTTDRMRSVGSSDSIEMVELDEFGSADAQKLAIEVENVGFPLRRWGNAIQWTRYYFEQTTAEEFAKQVNGITDADEVKTYQQIRYTLFHPTNTTFNDRMMAPVISLPVKALINGDGFPIPPGPGGKTFDGDSHTHYKGIATADTPAASDLSALIENVTEHFNTGNPVLYINKGNEAKIRALTGFNEYVDVRLTDQRNELVANGRNLDTFNVYDRAIGLFDGAEVWVKPWIPEDYILASVLGQAMPLVERVPVVQSAVGLRLVAQNEQYPLRANEYEHRYGFGVWNRLNGAVLDIGTGSSTYTEPSL